MRKIPTDSITEPARDDSTQPTTAAVSRRTMLGMLGAAAGSALIGGISGARAATSSPASGFVSKRPPKAQRRFVSTAVEQQITQIKARIADPELAWLFENCYPNTLDTTVETGTRNGKPDTFVITGDIHAMWLRDSSAQVHPYVPLARRDPALRRMFHGLIQRQAACIKLDPYANAFLPDGQTQRLKWSLNDITEMKPGVGERKWEIDSLCYPIRIAHEYWRATGDTAPFDDDWREAMHVVVRTFREQQRKDNRGPYVFQRPSPLATETLVLEGYGQPTKPNGMIHSMFRPSDDACVFPLFVPANLFAVASLRQLASMSTQIHRDSAFAADCTALADEVETATRQFGQMRDSDGQAYWAFEVDGYGNQLFIDDANAPGLSASPTSAVAIAPTRCSCARVSWPGASATRTSRAAPRPKALAARIAAWAPSGRWRSCSTRWSATTMRSCASACSGSRPRMPAPASCMRPSTRTTRPHSRVTGSPGPTPCSAN